MPTTTVRDTQLTSVGVVFTDDPATSNGFSMNMMTQGQLLITLVAPSGPCVLNFYVKGDARDSDMFLAHDDTGNLISLPVDTQKAYAIPAELASSRWVIPVCADSGHTVVARVVTKS